MQLPAIDERPVCQYCGEPVEDRRVDCARCATPHHRECFVECGVCTTYACGSRTFVVPGEATPVELPSPVPPAAPSAGWHLPPDLTPTPGGALVYQQSTTRGVDPLPVMFALMGLLVLFFVRNDMHAAAPLALLLPLLLMVFRRFAPPKLVVVYPRTGIINVYDDRNGDSLRRNVVAGEVRQVLLERHLERDADYRATVRLALSDDTVLLVRGFQRSTVGAREWARTLALVTGRPLFDDLDGEGRLVQPQELRKGGN